MRLTDHVELTPAEAGRLLEVLDVAATSARTDEERLAVREAVRMIAAKLWPELGDLLDGDIGLQRRGHFTRQLCVVAVHRQLVADPPRDEARMLLVGSPGPARSVR